MNAEFKQLLLDTLRIIKDHPDAKAGGVGFVTEFDEEPEWEVIISFAPKDIFTDVVTDSKLH